MNAARDLSDFSGPHQLTIQGITLAVTTITPGVYLLGTPGATGFVVKAIGRSQAHLRARLWSVVGNEPAFLFHQCKSEIEAFLLECELYHSLNFESSGPHPCEPLESDVHCPYCEAAADRDSSG